jgi:molybdopterin synthase sulfur carrier subunit
MQGAPEGQSSIVKLVYLARLREVLGTSHERYAVDGPTTVGQIREALRVRGGAWATELAPGRAVRAAVNHELASAETCVAPGDELAFFPPVTGG